MIIHLQTKKKVVIIQALSILLHIYAHKHATHIRIPFDESMYIYIMIPASRFNFPPPCFPKTVIKKKPEYTPNLVHNKSSATIANIYKHGR